MKRKNTLQIFLSLVILIGCNFNKPILIENKQECKPYFEFDTVEHFYFKIEEAKIVELERKNKRTYLEDFALKVYNDFTPIRLTDTLFINNLGKIGYIKTNIKTEKLESLNKIFCEREHKEFIGRKCEPVYRDILLFKKNNQITGIAKICFGCGGHVISGTSLNTGNFGQSGDYDKLYELLH